MTSHIHQFLTHGWLHSFRRFWEFYSISYSLIFIQIRKLFWFFEKSLSAVLELIKEKKGKITVCVRGNESVRGNRVNPHPVCLVLLSCHCCHPDQLTHLLCCCRHTLDWCFMCSIDWEVILWLESCVRFMGSVYHLFTFESSLNRKWAIARGLMSVFSYFVLFY